MPSVSRNSIRAAALASGALLLAGAAAGCSTTQEKAAAKRAEAQRILEARKHRGERPSREAGP